MKTNYPTRQYVKSSFAKIEPIHKNNGGCHSDIFYIIQAMICVVSPPEKWFTT